VETTYFTAVGEQKRQEHYAGILFGELHTREIRYMPMKGYCIRELYPQPAWRTSSDLELLCDEEKRAEIGEILLSYGFHQGKQTETDDVWVLDHVIITLHTRFAEADGRLADYFSDIWSRLYTTDGVEYHMTDEDYCIYILSQLSYYLWSGRLSIRTILDFYIYRHARPQLDRTYLEEQLQKLGLLRFALAMEELCEVWFGGGEQTNDTMLLGSFIASNSAYGEGATGEGKKLDPHGIFPPYYVMKRRYGVLKYCPFLLPVMWVVRWFAMLFSVRREEIKQETRRPSDKRTEKIRERVEQITGLAAPTSAAHAKPTP
jgi:hypothetical protein